MAKINTAIIKQKQMSDYFHMDLILIDECLVKKKSNALRS